MKKGITVKLQTHNGGLETTANVNDLSKPSKKELFMHSGKSALVSIMLVSSLSFANLAYAGSCDSAAKVTEDIWEKYGSVIKTVDVVEKPAMVLDSMFKFWNSMVGNTWKKIGPLQLTLDSTQKGKIVGTGGRMYISVQPLDEDQIELKIKKTDGKGKASVLVCTDNHGSKTKVWEFTIDNGKDNVGQTWNKTLNGVKGRILSVHFDGKSVANTMSYEINTTAK